MLTDTMSAFLTVNQVADALQLAPKSVYRLLRRGLPSYRLGRAVRISRADLDAYVAGQRAGEKRAAVAPKAKLKWL